MCDLSVTRYTFLENFYSSECVHCAEKFPVSTANEIFLPTSVSNAICMKYQRRWYKICARGLCAKPLNLKINVKLSAEICQPQKLSARNEHALHFVQNLLIPKSVARNFDRYGICMKYQRRWNLYEIPKTLIHSIWIRFRFCIANFVVNCQLII